ncbi:MAG: hypothetical protein ACI85U_003903, partial [Candidatus Promineifilaceae bacterium]
QQVGFFTVGGDAVGMDLEFFERNDTPTASTPTRC